MKKSYSKICLFWKINEIYVYFVFVIESSNLHNSEHQCVYYENNCFAYNF